MEVGSLGRSRKIISAPEKYEKTLAGILQETGCDAGGAPYVIPRLLRTLNERFKADPSKKVALAAAFLDEANCPGAHGLSEQDKSALRTIRGPAAPPPVATPAPPKP